MTRGRALSIRERLILLGVVGLLYGGVVTIQLGSVLLPAAGAVWSRSGDLIADHDRIVAGLAAMLDARRDVAAQAPPFPAGARRTVDLADARRRIRGLLEDGVRLRGAIDRGDLPLEMRALLAGATEQETELGVDLLDAIRYLELGRPAEAVTALRQSGVRSDSAEVLLSAVQREALRTMREGQEGLLGRLQRLERWALLWVVVGLGLFVLFVFVLRQRLLLPVRALARAVQRVAAGDLSVELAVERRDEIGQLTEHLNAMTAILRERAATETARREGITERFGRLLDASSNEIGVYDASTLRAVQLNRGARLGLGLDATQVGDVTLPEVLRAIDPVLLAEQLGRLRSGEQSRLFLTTRQTRRDGTTYPVEMSIQHSVDVDAELFITVAEDARTRERVRELDRALRDFTYAEQERQSPLTLPESLHAIATMAMQALHGARVCIWRHEAGAPVCLGSSDGPVADGGERRAFPTGAQHLSVPVPSSLRTATVLLVESADAPRRWSAEEQTFARAAATLVGRALDAAERHRLEQALARAQRMDSIGQLAGGVAHDFNNMLTAIIGNVEDVRAQLPSGSPMDASLAEVEAASRRATDLTRQLMTFARNQKVEVRVFDVNQVAREADRMLRRLIGEQIEFRTDLAPGALPVRIGSGQLEQLFVNLVVNARDAIGGRGTITMATRAIVIGGAGGQGHPSLPDGAYVEITVRDTGSGIAPDVIEHLFEPFFTTKPMGAGTGLGLAVCYGIVHGAAGEIEVQSATGQGTTFRILVPAALEAPAEPPRLVAGAASAGGHETLLVVEDERAIRDLVVRALARRGYRVLSAPDGQAAVELVASQEVPIDLLVTDVVMPRLSGPEAARALRERFPALPVLLMSGYTADALREGHELPDSDFLAKPFTPDELCRRVRTLLDARRAAAPTPA